MEILRDSEGRASIVPNLKTLLDDNERVYYHNGEDIAVAFKSRLTGDYCYMFNTKVLFGLKTFKTFLAKLAEYNAKHRMVVDLEEMA